MISIFLFLLGCNRNKKMFYTSTNKQHFVFAPKTKIDDNCKKVSSGFMNKFGISISNFYAIDQCIIIDNDSIGILKPFYTYSVYSHCFPEKADKNLLIIFNTKNNKTEIYDKVLFSNDREVYQELKPNRNGFIVYSDQGHSSKLFTNIFVSKTKIDSIKLESWGFSQYSKTYKFKNFNLDKFEIKFIDSLQEMNDAKNHKKKLK